ncbi:MAG: UDP-2,3-diacylglucosamine diphosphatase [Syntrophorhabdaceae bacterium]|nr:UDP-2,3-diacylglucosamine diphosphatase [Syntrophorhabdaceae bacterium]
MMLSLSIMENPLPFTPSRAIFIADAHLNQDDVHSLTFLKMAKKAALEDVPMFLLGDIFDLWFGAAGLTFRFQKPIIARLRELRSQGLRIAYVEGNRDFYLGREHAGTTLDLVCGDNLRFTVGGLRVYLSHGDTVNKADLWYRFWKAISKNRFANNLVSSLPGWFFLPIAARVERKLKRYNRRHKESFPEEDCKRYATERFAEGSDIVVLGHFHQERLMPQNGDVVKLDCGSEADMGANEKKKLVAVLPCWKESYRYFYIADDGTIGFRAFSPEAPLIP